MSGIQSYRVEWFVTDTARRDVTVRIHDGRLINVESGRATDAIELGSVALISGLVNAHTHLEFSGFSSPIPTEGRFTDWIRAVVGHRRAHPDNAADAIRAGLQECLQSGTTLVGEIATSGWPELFGREDLDDRTDIVVFQEVLGLLPDRIAQQAELARYHVANKTGRSVDGISPHAPYSTHLDLVRTAVDLARQTGCPLAMHLAETRAELEFLADRTGEFREMLTDFGLWRDDQSAFGRQPMDYLKLLALAPRSLIVHGNYLTDDELKFLAENPQMTLVYCPRTHAAFGHSEHPWRRLLEFGGRVAIGTDSRASNPDLSLFAELQFLAAQHPEISQLELLQLGSASGRQALGLASPDRADFTLVQLGSQGMDNPDRELFSATNRVGGTIINGNWAWRLSDR